MRREKRKFAKFVKKYAKKGKLLEQKERGLKFCDRACQAAHRAQVASRTAEALASKASLHIADMAVAHAQNQIKAVHSAVNATARYNKIAKRLAADSKRKWTERMERLEEKRQEQLFERNFKKKEKEERKKRNEQLRKTDQQRLEREKLSVEDREVKRRQAEEARNKKLEFKRAMLKIAKQAAGQVKKNQKAAKRYQRYLKREVQRQRQQAKQWQKKVGKQHRRAEKLMKKLKAMPKEKREKLEKKLFKAEIAAKQSALRTLVSDQVAADASKQKEETEKQGMGLARKKAELQARITSQRRQAEFQAKLVQLRKRALEQKSKKLREQIRKAKRAVAKRNRDRAVEMAAKKAEADRISLMTVKEADNKHRAKARARARAAKLKFQENEAKKQAYQRESQQRLREEHMKHVRRSEAENQVAAEAAAEDAIKATLAADQRAKAEREAAERKAADRAKLEMQIAAEKQAESKRRSDEQRTKLKQREKSEAERLARAAQVRRKQQEAQAKHRRRLEVLKRKEASAKHKVAMQVAADRIAMQRLRDSIARKLRADRLRIKRLKKAAKHARRHVEKQAKRSEERLNSANHVQIAAEERAKAHDRRQQLSVMTAQQSEQTNKRQQRLQVHRMKVLDKARRRKQEQTRKAMRVVKRKELARKRVQEQQHKMERAARKRREHLAHKQRRAEHRAKLIAARQTRAQRIAAFKRKEGGFPIPLANFTQKVLGFKPPVYSFLGQLCVLSGAVRSSSLLGVLATLPRNCRPRSAHSFLRYVKPGLALQLNVHSNGTIIGAAAQGGAASGLLSLDGIAFPVAHVTQDALAPLTTWTPLGSGFESPGFVKHGDLCVVSGVLQTQSLSKWGTQLTTLPVICQPAEGRLSFSVISGAEPHRVDVFADGRVMWVAGNRKATTLSLDGITFHTRTARTPTLLNKWQPFGLSYRRPTFRREGLFCVASGLLKNAKLSPVLLKLPSYCRPAYRVSTVLGSHANVWRVDVFPNGEVRYIQGLNTQNAVSLDGLRFMVDFNRRKHVAHPLHETARAPLTLRNKFLPDSSRRFGAPYAVHMGEVCVLNGAALVPKGGLSLKGAVVPKACRPRKRIVFTAVTQGLVPARVDVFPTGQVQWRAGPNSRARWLSLDGLVIPTPSAFRTGLRLSASWQPYGSKDLQPSFFRSGAFCVLSGRIRVQHNNLNAWRPHIATLPRGCRPVDGTIRFTLNHGGVTHGVQIGPDGRVIHVAGQIRLPWLSLAGISFFSESASQPVQLTKFWKPLGRQWRRPSYRRSGSLCVVSGMAVSRKSKPKSLPANPNAPQRRPAPVTREQLRKIAQRKRIVTVLPQNCRPLSRRVFVTNQRQFNRIVFVYPNGQVVVSRQKAQWSSLALDGITFTVPSRAEAEQRMAKKSAKIQRRLAASAPRPSVAPGKAPLANSADQVAKITNIPSAAPGAPVAKLPLPAAPASPSAKPKAKAKAKLAPAATPYPVFLPFPKVAASLRPGGKQAPSMLAAPLANSTAPLNKFPFVVPASALPQLPAGLHVGRQALKSKGVIATLGRVRALGQGYLKPQYTRVGGFCVLNGAFAASDLRVNYGRLPLNCRPRKHSVFHTAVAGGKVVRVDVSANGIVSYGGGSVTKSPWVPVDGFIFPVRGARSNTLRLEEGWAHFGGHYGKARYRVERGMCVLSGVVRVHGFNMTRFKPHVLTLPSACRPQGGPVQFAAAMHTSSNRVDINPDGTLLWKAGKKSSPWLSLDGIAFFVKSSQPFKIASPFRAVTGKNIRKPSFRRLGNVCALSGAVKMSGGDGKKIGTIAAVCRPARRLIFLVNNNNKPIRLDLFPDGSLLIPDGRPSAEPLSLDGIRYVVDNRLVRKQLKVPRLVGKEIDLGPYYSPYGLGFLGPQYVREGPFCFLAGHAHGPKRITGALAYLPRDCTPTHRQSFDAHVADTVTMRMDVKPNGAVVYSGGSRASSWFDLSQLVVSVSGGRPLALEKPWLNIGNGFAAAHYIVDRGFCALFGTVRFDSSAAKGKDAGRMIARLPLGCRPIGGTVVLSANTGAKSVRVDIHPDGGVILSAHGQAVPDWVSLSGLRFAATSKNALRLARGYSLLGKGFRAPSWTRVGRVCVLSGMVARSGGDRHIFRLPRKCRPSGRATFHSNHGEFAWRLDAFPNGTVSWVDGADRFGFVSLDGIHFVVNPFRKPSTPLLPLAQFRPKLLNRMQAYQGGFLPPTVTRHGRLCMASGLLRGSPARLTGNYTRVPQLCRPSRQLHLHSTRNFNHGSRASLGRDGTLKWGGGARNPDWVSLSGAIYPVKGAGAYRLPLTPPWQHAAKNLSKPTVTRNGDLCVLTGNVQIKPRPGTDQFNTPITVLPRHCRPDRRIVVVSNRGRSIQHLDISPTGSVTLMRRIKSVRETHGKRYFKWLAWRRKQVKRARAVHRNMSKARARMHRLFKKARYALGRARAALMRRYQAMRRKVNRIVRRQRKLRKRIAGLKNRPKRTRRLLARKYRTARRRFARRVRALRLKRQQLAARLRTATGAWRIFLRNKLRRLNQRALL